MPSLFFEAGTKLWDARQQAVALAMKEAKIFIFTVDCCINIVGGTLVYSETFSHVTWKMCFYTVCYLDLNERISRWFQVHTLRFFVSVFVSMSISLIYEKKCSKVFMDATAIASSHCHSRQREQCQPQ